MRDEAPSQRKSSIYVSDDIQHDEDVNIHTHDYTEERKEREKEKEKHIPVLAQFQQTGTDTAHIEYVATIQTSTATNNNDDDDVNISDGEQHFSPRSSSSPHEKVHDIHSIGVDQKYPEESQASPQEKPQEIPHHQKTGQSRRFKPSSFQYSTSSQLLFKEISSYLEHSIESFKRGLQNFPEQVDSFTHLTTSFLLNPANVEKVLIKLSDMRQLYKKMMERRDRLVVYNSSHVKYMHILTLVSTQLCESWKVKAANESIEIDENEEKGRSSSSEYVPCQVLDDLLKWRKMQLERRRLEVICSDVEDKLKQSVQIHTYGISSSPITIKSECPSLPSLPPPSLKSIGQPQRIPRTPPTRRAPLPPPMSEKDISSIQKELEESKKFLQSFTEDYLFL
eukprot:gnl/Carplike_NY0171/2631_a3533_357.p1 GENE.gnl/Carplike_NY0171/2631_a3533_357~~gnl/Carplike_NY0171/2631_a3533_357.p1  ORF type:complete len:418 (-),score=109.16 gnl/Carplike_NY0171/2631_a3533_357:145-1326(-)